LNNSSGDLPGSTWHLSQEFLVFSSRGMGTAIFTSTISSPRHRLSWRTERPSPAAQFLAGLGAPESSTGRGHQWSGLRSSRPEPLPGRHRHGEVDIVAVAAEHDVVAGADDGVQVSRRTAVHARVALTARRMRLAITRARLNADFKRLGALDVLSLWQTGQVEIFFPSVAARAGLR